MSLVANEDKTVSHALFTCGRIKQVWEECGCIKMLSVLDCESMADVIVKWMEMDQKMVQMGCLLAQNLWIERNNFVFEEKAHLLKLWHNAQVDKQIIMMLMRKVFILAASVC